MQTKTMLEQEQNKHKNGTVEDAGSMNTFISALSKIARGILHHSMRFPVKD